MGLSKVLKASDKENIPAGEKHQRLGTAGHGTALSSNPNLKRKIIYSFN